MDMKTNDRVKLTVEIIGFIISEHFMLSKYYDSAGYTFLVNPHRPGTLNNSK